MNQKNKNLAQFFPIIRTKEQILSSIDANEKLKEIFSSWETDQQERFLSICTGAKGVKMLYDSYFKEILNPETTPERLSQLLTILLKRQVTVKYALTNDNSRLGDEMSLVITDIVVELDDPEVTNAKVVARLTQLVKLGEVFKTDVKDGDRTVKAYSTTPVDAE